MFISEEGTGHSAYQWLHLSTNAIYDYGNNAVEQFDAVWDESGRDRLPGVGFRAALRLGDPLHRRPTPAAARAQLHDVHPRRLRHQLRRRGLVALRQARPVRRRARVVRGAGLGDNCRCPARLEPDRRARHGPDVDDGTPATFVTSGLGSGDTKSASGYSGSSGLVYKPHSSSITVDLAIFTADAVHVRWYDPTTGDYHQRRRLHRRPAPKSSPIRARTPAANPTGYSWSRGSHPDDRGAYCRRMASLDVDEMLARFRDRAAAVKRRPLPPVAGEERQAFIAQAQLDFQDFAIIGDAAATIEDGVLSCGSTSAAEACRRGGGGGRRARPAGGRAGGRCARSRSAPGRRGPAGRARRRRRRGRRSRRPAAASGRSRRPAWASATSVITTSRQTSWSRCCSARSDGWLRARAQKLTSSVSSNARRSSRGGPGRGRGAAG